MATWILDFHPDFPGSERLARHLGPARARVVDGLAALGGRWPSSCEGPLVGYGTMRTMTALRRHPTLGRAVFDDYAALRCSSYYRHVFDLLGRRFVFSPLGALPGLGLERLFGERVFVRPDSNLKLFAARVLPAAALAELAAEWAVHRGELVVAAQVVEIVEEFRCFCSHGRFRCGSSYPDEPYHAVPDEVRAFAEVAAARLEEGGLPLVTVDVGRLASGALVVVEAGGVNSWGVYGADLDAFVAMMEEEAVEREEASR
ncbi:MAG: ATP-grasp domain-containing protein [Myxococcales bacterium]